jgi:pilus assembly protein CpaB
MNKRLAAVLAFAFVVSAGASLLLYKLISARLASASPQPTGHLIVAARDLPVGTMIRDLDLKQVDWTGDPPAQAVVKSEDIAGRGVVANIYAGEPILENRLAPKGAGAGLAATIPLGKRAVAIRVNDIVGVAGFVTPGMHVDVLILGNPPGGGAQAGTVSKTLLQNMEVLSAGQQIQKDAEGKPISVPVVNLLVTPEQAEIMSLASNDARIQLVLRNPLDQEEAKTKGVALARLFTGLDEPSPTAKLQPKARPRVAPPPPPPPPKANPPIVVEVLHGARKAEAKFQDKAEDK